VVTLVDECQAQDDGDDDDDDDNDGTSAVTGTGTGTTSTTIGMTGVGMAMGGPKCNARLLLDHGFALQPVVQMTTEVKQQQPLPQPQPQPHDCPNEVTLHIPISLSSALGGDTSIGSMVSDIWRSLVVPASHGGEGGDEGDSEAGGDTSAPAAPAAPAAASVRLVRIPTSACRRNRTSSDELRSLPEVFPSPPLAAVWGGFIHLMRLMRLLVRRVGY
jgi:hypothetical protein